VYVQRTQHASAAMLGVNNTVTCAVHRSERQALGAGAGTIDDFAVSPTIEQQGASVTWARRISEFSSVNVLGTHVRSSGAGDLGTTQSTVTVALSRRLGARTFGTLGARMVRFDNRVGADSEERAISASVAMTF
jgi:uncharacterized protein (PEP-CTERM system associated)